MFVFIVSKSELQKNKGEIYAIIWKNALIKLYFSAVLIKLYDKNYIMHVSTLNLTPSTVTTYYRFL